MYMRMHIDIHICTYVYFLVEGFSEFQGSLRLRVGWQVCEALWYEVR